MDHLGAPELLAAYDFIWAVNPKAGAATLRRIMQHVEALGAHPLIGRTGAVDGTRELIVSRTRYFAVYEVFNGEVLILRLLHSAQEWPPGSGESGD